MTSDQQLVIVSIAETRDELVDAFHVGKKAGLSREWLDDMGVAITATFPEARKEFALKNLERLRAHPGPMADYGPELLGEVLRELVLHSVHDLDGESLPGHQRVPDIVPPDIRGPMRSYWARGNALVQFLYSLPEYFQPFWELRDLVWEGAYQVVFRFPGAAAKLEGSRQPHDMYSTWLLAAEWSAMHPITEPRFGYDPEAVPDPEEWAGTVIHGTLREEDLFEAFFDVYVQLPGATPGRALLYLKDWEPEDHAYRPDVLQELADELNALAPEGLYFGANEGDASDFGFWPVEEEDEE